MGYRVHYAKKYEVEWAGGAFNHDSTGFNEMVAAKLSGGDDFWNDDDSEEFELQVDVMEEYITELRAKPEETNEFFAAGDYTYTNAEVADYLQEMVDGRPKDADIIHLCWF